MRLATFDRRSTPVILVSRDRPDSLSKLVGWLERIGCENLHIVDMDSTHPDLIEYLDASPHRVHRLSENSGPHSLWPSGLVTSISAGKPFVLSDPDVLPIEECPPDAIDLFADVLGRYPTLVKAGFGLRIDDIPDDFEHAVDVRAWESQFWRRRIRGNLYSARIDTTFALYRSDAKFSIGPAVRTGHPYLARHLPWYERAGQLSDEENYYRAHASTVTTWSATKHRSAIRPPFSLLDRLKWRAHVALRMRPQGSAGVSDQVAH